MRKKTEKNSRKLVPVVIVILFLKNLVPVKLDQLQGYFVFFNSSVGKFYKFCYAGFSALMLPTPILKEKIEIASEGKKILFLTTTLAVFPIRLESVFAGLQNLGPKS